MAKIEEIMDVTRKPGDIINDLMVKTIQIPSWGKLVEEYETKRHPVFTDPNYADDAAKKVRLSRIGLGWNKLAVKRMSELAFGIPVKRVYAVDKDNEAQMMAKRVLESIYAKNHMDAVNIARARALYSSCEFATIWYSKMEDTVYGGLPSKLKVRCKTYSPLTGEQIYPLFDDFDDLIALSVRYARTIGENTIEYFETYTANEHARWRYEDRDWVEDTERESIQIGKIAGVYAHRTEPIWEGESANVYEAEWALSRNGNYLRKNSKPNWVVRCDKEDLAQYVREKDDDTTSRNVLFYPKDAQVGFETWNQAIDTLKFQTESIRQNYFRQLQLPDISFETMKSVALSGESRKMMFIDAQLKVLDEAGPWKETFEREMSVIKAFAVKMFPSIASEIDAIEVEHVITPYQIGDELERSQIAAALNGNKPVISQRTSIERYGCVDDVDAELTQIAQEQLIEQSAF